MRYRGSTIHRIGSFLLKVYLLPLLLPHSSSVSPDCRFSLSVCLCGVRTRLLPFCPTPSFSTSCSHFKSPAVQSFPELTMDASIIDVVQVVSLSLLFRYLSGPPFVDYRGVPDTGRPV